MIRSGYHTVSVMCTNWLAAEEDFQDVINLVNTNNNLVVDTNNNMELESALGSIKKQLWYAEIRFRGYDASDKAAMEFLKSQKVVLDNAIEK